MGCRRERNPAALGGNRCSLSALQGTECLASAEAREEPAGIVQVGDGNNPLG